MQYVSEIQYNGKEIILINFPDNATNDVFNRVMDQAAAVIRSRPLNSVYTLTVFGNFHFNQAAAKRIQEYARDNKPYVKAGAVVGVGGVKKIIYNTTMMVTGRKLRICNSIDEAKEYLATVS